MNNKILSIYDALDQFDQNKEDEDQFEMMEIQAEICEKIKEQDKEVFESVQKAMMLRYNFAGNSTKLEPAIIFYGKWRTVGPQDFTEDDHANLKSLEKEKLPLCVRARVDDVLWILWHDYNAVIDAIDSYHSLFRNTFNEDTWYDGIDLLERSIHLSRQIKNKQKLSELMETAYEYLKKYKNCKKYSFLLKLIEILIQGKTNYYAYYLSVLKGIRGEYTGSLPDVMESTFKLERECYLMIGDKQNADNALIELAEFFENTAKQQDFNSLRGIMIASENLKKAYHIFYRFHEHDKARSVITLLDTIQTKRTSMLQKVKVSIDENALTPLKDIETKLKQLSIEESLMFLVTIAHKMKKETIRNLIENNSNPYLSLVTTDLLDNKGRIVFKLPSLMGLDHEKYEEAFLYHMYHKANELEDELGFIIRFSMNIIREKYEITKNELRIFVDQNAMIPDGREDILLSAFDMFFQGKDLESMYILVPQVEYIIRTLAGELGAVTTVLKDDIEEELSLGKIFNSQELKDGYDEDVLFTLRGLLIEGAGGNIRNDIAHGLYDESSANNNVTAYFVCFIMAFLANTSKNCMKIIKNSEFFKKIIQEKKKK